MEELHHQPEYKVTAFIIYCKLFCNNYLRVLSSEIAKHLQANNIKRDKKRQKKLRPLQRNSRKTFIINNLFYVKQQSFQVFPFRMKDIYRMIGRLVQPVQDSDLAASLGGGRKYCQCKRFLRDHLRTTEGEYESTWSHLGNGGSIETLIGAEGIVECSSVLGECRRVHYHQVVFVFRNITQIVQRIYAKTGVAGFFEPPISTFLSTRAIAFAELSTESTCVAPAPKA